MMITPTRPGSKMGHDDASEPLQGVCLGSGYRDPCFDAAGL